MLIRPGKLVRLPYLGAGCDLHHLLGDLELLPPQALNVVVGLELVLLVPLAMKPLRHDVLHALVLLRLRVELDLLKVLGCGFDEVLLLVDDGVHVWLHEFLDVSLPTIVYLVLETLVDDVVRTVNVVFLY
jgi:hypothetical protein